MKKFLALFSIVFSAFAFSCASVEQVDDALAMGVILPFRESPERAVEMYNAMKLAIDELNEGRAEPFKLELYSDSYNASETSLVLQDMLDSKANILHIGVRDAVVFKKEALDKSAKFINYMNDYAPATLGDKNAVRIFLSATDICEQMGKIVDKTLLEERSELRVVALGTDDLLTRSAVAYLKYEVQTSQVKFYDNYFEKGESNFKIFAEHLESLAPDYIFVMGSGEENADILKALNALSFSWKVAFNSPLRGIVHTGSYFLVEPEFFTPINSKKEISTKVFEDKYKQAYGKTPKNYEAYYAYDSIILSGKAYDENPESMRKYFAGKTFQGAVGSISFDTTGDSKVKMKTSFSLIE